MLLNKIMWCFKELNADQIIHLTKLEFGHNSVAPVAFLIDDVQKLYIPRCVDCYSSLGTSYFICCVCRCRLRINTLQDRVTYTIDKWIVAYNNWQSIFDKVFVVAVELHLDVVKVIFCKMINFIYNFEMVTI